MQNAPLTPNAVPDSDDDATLFSRLDAIVIGASAGGVEALNRLLPALPASLPVPVLLVLHLLPDVHSELAFLFGARCTLNVLEANDRQPLHAGTVYIAPPGYHLLVGEDRTCSLSVDDAVNFSRPSIDVLFESAAWTYRARVLGLLLTGASADGAMGLRQIRGQGGLAWVQSPETAQADTMPLAAIALGATDRVLTIEAMAQSLRRASEAFAASSASSAAHQADAAEAADAAAPSAAPPQPSDKEPQ